MQRGTSHARAGCLAAVLFAAGCASPVTHSDSGFRHRKHHYSIAVPDGPGAAWERVSVKGTALAFQRSGPESISLQSRCGRPVASAQLMARHLVIGLSDRTLLESGPVEVDGRDGWAQTFDTVQADTAVRVKTVTLVAGTCTYDWVLASAGRFEPAEAAFDAWWQSFHLLREPKPAPEQRG